MANGEHCSCTWGKSRDKLSSVWIIMMIVLTTMAMMTITTGATAVTVGIVVALTVILCRYVQHLQCSMARHHTIPVSILFKKAHVMSAKLYTDAANSPTPLYLFLHRCHAKANCTFLCAFVPHVYSYMRTHPLNFR